MKKIDLLLLLLFVLMLPSCGWKSSGDKKTIAVSIEPMRYFTEQICGDKFRVVSLVPKGSNPETYEPTPQQLVELSKSEAFFNLGQIGFELTWSDKIGENAPGTRNINVSQGIDLIYGIDDHIDEPVHYADHAHITGADPHVWCSVTNVRIIAANIYEALLQIDPANKDTYHTNYLKFLSSLDTLQEEIETYMAKGTRAFLIYHPALTYWARDYGLTQLALEAEGKEPDPNYLHEVISNAKKDSVRLFFQQEEIDPRKSESIVKLLHLDVVKVNVLSYDWQDEMLRIARAFAEVHEKEES